MATAKAKLRREDLAKDEVAETVEELLLAFRRHRLKIVAGVAGAFLLVSLYGLFSARRASILRETNRVLNQATIVIGELPNIEDETTRENNLRGAIAELERLAERYAGTPASRLALYLQGNCYYYMDDLERAREAFERYIEEARTPEERARGELAVGYTLENQFFLHDEPVTRLEDARVRYVRAEQAAPPGSYPFYQALLNQARVLELTYRDAEALALYRRVLEERPPARAVRGGGGEGASARREGIEGFVEQQLDDLLRPLSFYATAKLLADRLEATSKVIRPQEPAQP